MRGWILGLAVLGLIGAGDDPPKPMALFDGKTLDGWRPTKGSPPEAVRVADGVITLATGSPMTGITSTRGDLPKIDYLLSYEARRTQGNDFFAAATFPVRESFVTLVAGGWGGSVTGLSLINGSSAAENPTNHFIRYANDTWYRFEVAVTARAVQVRIDGKEVFTFDHADTELKTRIESRANEPLGFASWRSTGQVRRAEVRPLTPDEIKKVESRLEPE